MRPDLLRTPSRTVAGGTGRVGGGLRGRRRGGDQRLERAGVGGCRTQVGVRAIEDVAPNVRAPQVRPTGSTGVFTVDCGTNGNRKLSPDNPVAQPGVKNGAQHVHDFVGNLSISADSSDASLEDSDTTCRNGDKSSYFWPVVRINRQANVGGRRRCPAPRRSAARRWPTGFRRYRQPARAEVDQNLALLGRQIAEANQRLAATRGQGGAGLRQQRRSSGRCATSGSPPWTASPSRSAAAGPGRPAWQSLADCDLSYDGAHAGTPGTARHGAGAAHGAGGDADGELPDRARQAARRPGPGARRGQPQPGPAGQADRRGQPAAGHHPGPGRAELRRQRHPRPAARTSGPPRWTGSRSRSAATPPGRPGLESLAPCTLNNAGAGDARRRFVRRPRAASDLPGVQGPNLEVAGNVGGIVRPASVTIEYRGNADQHRWCRCRSSSRPSPATPSPPAADRPTPAPPGPAAASPTGCPTSTSSARPAARSCGCTTSPAAGTARTPTAPTTATTSSSPTRPPAPARPAPSPSRSCGSPSPTTFPRNIQKKGQYQLDSFPEENHNPFSDHNDFVNVNSTETMARIAACINAGRRCK